MATLLNSPAAVLPERPRLLHLWHLASLDAPTVAVTWALALGWCAGVHLRAVALILLALSTWIIYVADRLLDVYRAKNHLRERHFFHWRHRRRFLPLAGIGLAATAAIAWIEIPPHVRRPDALAALAAIGWLTGVHARAKIPIRLPQPLAHVAVGLIFAGGCALPVWPRVASLGALPYAAIFGFAALAWLNLRGIEAWEAEAPATVAPAAFALAAAGAGAAAFSSPRIAALFAAQAAAALLLGVLDRNQGKISPLTLRALADLVLLTPAVLLLV